MAAESEPEFPTFDGITPIRNFYISFFTDNYYMKSETEPKIIGLLAVLIGILMILYPQLVGYLVGVFLIAYGLLKVFAE